MKYYVLYVENTKSFFTYKSEEEYKPGEWCIVDFSGRKRSAVILRETEEDKIDFDIKKIKEIDSRADILSIPEDIIKLMDWMAVYYISDYYNVIKTVFPGILKLNYSQKAVFYKELENAEKYNSETIKDFNDYMKKKKVVTSATLIKKFGKDLVSYAQSKDAVKIEKHLVTKENKIKEIETDGIINETDIELNEEQKNTVEAIENGNNDYYLIKGITGSGKTEVYIRLIKNALKSGGGSIFLVPEISLTPQMMDRLKREFSNNVALLHSRLTTKERKEEWNAIKSGNKKVVIGARSAVFAPVQNLKYIILDEEHETTYKQESNPRYHTKNVAIKRANLLENVKVILGSATPSFDTYYQAKEGVIELLELKNRYNDAKKPVYDLVNLQNVNGNFSHELLEKISEKLLKNEQIILILNRKAFSTFIKCRDCGTVETCPNCSISLNYYRKENKLKCHYCGYEKYFKPVCGNCGSKNLIHLGTGTEKIELELGEIFKDARILRIDSENTKTQEQFEKMYNDFKNHKYDILLGTQIIAKGFHFPNVTLVSIINADIILNFPDFRAGEKTYQLLTQASGRSGREKKEGEVLIQTYDPDNDAIKKTISDNYEGYYENEMEIRKILKYPPYGRIINIVISSETETGLKEKAEKFYNMIKEKNSFIPKPFKAPIYRINNRYRYQIFIKSDRISINNIKHRIRSSLVNYREKDVRISVDVDPVNLL
ncbi:Primosomal protein N' [Sebaldella termitidis]|uniref:Replication restart protein PriA n=1 Tax=Sebaldella termitidis (strain ATCC 33386 / NCTC 11300) TaxID=526218 RepID=D1AH07_SEBTE|nr:primosomal protein N' [Sebaldella termitidis]ACZ08041.1 primosomal protein N' [Sebaldella termitidis ATCC 33386]SUI23342.1 Primosomal protein N' [Sebaldella termitidis]